MLPINYRFRVKCLSLLCLSLFLVSCSSYAIDGKSKRIGDVLAAEASSDLVNSLNLEEYSKGFWSGMYWYKGTVSPEWFHSQIERLENSGYTQFTKSENLDLEAKVFSKSEWSKPYWHSVARVENSKRFSIYYQEETEVLTLIWYSY